MSFYWWEPLTVGLFLFFSVFLGVALSMYHSEIKNKQTMSFKEYLRISACAPEKWEIYDDGATCHLVYHPSGYPDECYERREIYMKSYIDYLRLCSLYKSQKKKGRDKIWTQERAELIKYFQRDINAYQKQYIKEMKGYLDKEDLET